jgi:hydroxymethylpyrimidine/phosphomethylpyrimidine kinase
VTDLSPAAVKSGMLANTSIIRTVAEAVAEHRLESYVLDPVMVATSGDLLIEESAVAAIRDELIPLALLVTPNADEAAVLTGLSIRCEDDMRKAAEAIAAFGAKAVLIKGGHVTGEDPATVVDYLYDGSFVSFRHARIDTTSTHGTGCTLSAAITALLANGASLHDAVEQAIDFVNAAIATAPGLGRGNGPLNHFAGNAETNSRTSA